MTWRCNRWHLEDVTFWNMSENIINDAGLDNRTKEEEVILSAFIVNNSSMFFYDGNGRFKEKGVVFQVSEKELEDNEFEIITGRTHFNWNSNMYRVTEVMNYKRFRHTQLIEGRAVREIDVD